MSALSELIDDILKTEKYFLDGIQRKSSHNLLIEALVEWGTKFNRRLDDIMSVLEPCFRQSIFMSLLPAAAFDNSDSRTYKEIIEQHLKQIHINLTEQQLDILVSTCVNINKIKDLKGRVARNRCKSIADIRGDNSLFSSLMKRQNERCIWCGVPFSDPNVKLTLEHVTPVHIGNDMPDTSNWALACLECNMGKADSLAWSSKPESHDYMSRHAFSKTGYISLEHRWSVLFRCKKCKFCHKCSDKTELKICKTISTGLPVPLNCSVVCVDCAKANNISLLTPIRLNNAEASTC